jgi:1-deoxy-D-xylulose-5-phosphate reductoisomerase
VPAGGKPELRIAILGSTGSIGRQALEVIAHLDALDPDFSWRVQSLACDSSVAELAAQARATAPRAVACSAEHSAELEAELAGGGVKVLSGDAGLAALASDPEADLLLLAIYGTRALGPLMAAISAGKPVALASKEALVAAGPLVVAELQRHKIDLRPVDSEHNALWQCLAGVPREQVASVVLTASGGPFYGMGREQLTNVTYEQALAHPVWSMGNDITINSATLFNKGLEIIEACQLFSLKAAQVEVLVHPQGQVHAMALLRDGSVILHAAEPDMRIPVQYALSYPRRLPALGNAGRVKLDGWQFQPADSTAFPALQACRSALDGPWWLPGALVAVNEELCAAFKRRAIGFNAIGDTLLELSQAPDKMLSPGSNAAEAFPLEIYGVFLAERAARNWARQRLGSLVRTSG